MNILPDIIRPRYYQAYSNDKSLKRAAQRNRHRAALICIHGLRRLATRVKGVAFAGTGV